MTMTKSVTTNAIDLNLTGLGELVRFSNHEREAGRVRIASISDIHLGHARVPTRFILANLAKFLHNPEYLSRLDIIVFGGDVFDKILYLNQDFISDIDVFMILLFKLAKQFGITIIFLEGTPSHDRKQPKRFIEINEDIAKINADVRYFDTISIEYFPKWDLTCLFIPDEMHHDTSVILKQVQELLRSRALDQVDFAFMHGNFTYQLPDVARAPRHDELSYLNIVKYAIFIGHIHTSSEYSDPRYSSRILAQGSFDRTAHGQEELKGFFEYTLKNKVFSDYQFVVNEGAKVFKTIDCRHLGLEDALDKIDQEVKGLPDESYVRLFIEASSLLRDKKLVAARYPTYIWEVKTEEALRIGQLEDIKIDLDYKAIYITPETVGELLKQRLESEGVDEATIINTLSILDELLE